MAWEMLRIFFFKTFEENILVISSRRSVLTIYSFRGTLCGFYFFLKNIDNVDVD
jgi:hypothetical protein